MSCLPNEDGRDNKKNSQHMLKPHSVRKSSDSDDDVMGGGDAVLDPLPPDAVIKGDIHPKHTTKTPSIPNHSQEGTMYAIALADMDGSRVIEGVMPLPLPSPLEQVPLMAGHQLVSRPGAYAQRPGGAISRRTIAEDYDDEDGVNTIGSPEAEAGDSQEGLVVANLVEETSLDFAIPDSKERRSQREDKTRQYKTCVLLSVLFLLAMGAVLSAALFPSPATSQDEFDDLDTASIPQSHAPTSLEGYVLSLLPQETVNAILDDANSSQSKAFRWLMDDFVFDMPDEQIKQRFALATLYFATNGIQWSENTNWLNYNVSECDWFTKGEFVMQKQFSTMIPGYLSEFFHAIDAPITICDQHGHYQHLWLDQNNLVGCLPEELYLLTHLQTISMAFNGLEGAISSRIGLLSDLQGWALIYLAIGGTIPTQIGLLTNLRLISIENNGHSGSIPTEIWQLTQLEIISFSRNPQLKGTIPTEIGTFANLSWFSIDETGFSGTIPTEIAKPQSIKMLVLFRNTLSGNVPSELGLLTGLFYLGLGYNNLTGTIPTWFGLLTSLSQLSLPGNLLEGQIPSQFGLINFTWSLNLRGNQLTGTIPSELGLLTGLYELELRDNILTGEIPSELGQATAMGFISLANNSLSGSIPQELYALSVALHTLSLEDNPLLSGILPNDICEMNGSCVGNGFNPCEGPYGFSFNCSSLLCGCGCDWCLP